MSLLAHSLALMFLGPAPPPGECTEQAVAALFAQERYDDVLDRARRCVGPYFHFAAGQARYYKRQYPKAIVALEKYLKAAPSDDRHRKFANSLYQAALKAVEAEPRIDHKPRPNGKPNRAKDPAPDSTTTSNETARVEPKPPTTPTSDPPQSGHGPPTGGDHPPAADPTRVDPPKVDSPRSELRPSRAETLPAAHIGTAEPVASDSPAPPEFRRGWLGLGITAAALTVAGVGMVIPGALNARDAFARNTRTLESAGLDATFPYGACATSWSAECAAASELETDGYSAAAYHRDLALASRLQVAGVITAGTAAGGLLGALPIRAATPRARRRGLLATLGVGAGLAFVGAFVFGTSRWDLGDKLQGIDAAGRGETWRTTPEQFWQAQGVSLAGGALLGLGTGALLGAGLGMLVEHRPTKLKAHLRLVPRALGLVVSGRF